MDFLTLDFETYYAQEYSLSSASTESYVRDPRFEVILVGTKLNDGRAGWDMPDSFRRLAEQTDWAQTAVIAHHAHFDGLILAHHFGIRPAFWIDTLSMARMIDGPKAGNSLEILAPRHGFGEKGHAVQWAKGKRLADFTAQELHAYGEYCCNDCDLEYALAMKFMPLIPEPQLRMIDLTVRMFTEPVFEGDVDKLRTAVDGEKARKAALLQRIGVDKKTFSSSTKFAKLLHSVGVEVPMKTSGTTGEPIPAFARTDPGMQELLEDQDEVVRFLAETRIAVKSTIIETRAERFHGMAMRGPMPVYLKVFGAHTLRWAGGDSTNWQNMSTYNENRPDLAVLKESIRAPQGCKVVAADSGQIEARMVNWLARSAVLQAFAEGRDVYSEFASGIYKRPIDRKNNPADHVPGQLGKVSILGLGFGMGWYKFAMELLKGMLGAKPIQFTMEDIERMQIDPSRFLNNPYKVQQVEAMPSRLELNDRLIHALVANAIVDHYRASNPEVVEYWALMETVIDAMIAGEELVFGAHGVMRTAKEKIVGPNGTWLDYRGLQRDESGQASYFNGRTRSKIYGGLATENVVQWLSTGAGGVVGEQTLPIAERYKVGLLTHDEIACVVPDAQAEEALRFMLDTMNTAPAWAPGLPLKAEGGIGQTYAEV